MIRNGGLGRNILLLAAFALYLASGLTDHVMAEDADDSEPHISELQRIIDEDPNDEVRKLAKIALDAFHKGGQKRNPSGRGRRIVNGLPSNSYPAVGALLKGGDTQTAKTWCTGTLVGCDKFLTAAHCIADDPAPESYLVFFQELGFFKLKGISWAKDHYEHGRPYFDLAMLTLAEPVEGIAPMAVNTQVEPLLNSPATIVGFGRTGGRRFDYGIKREGGIRTEACPVGQLPFLANARVLCWRFDAGVIASGSASNTCNADSGGGIFMRDEDGHGSGKEIDKLFGVVSGGMDNSCIDYDIAVNVDVFHFRDWIEKEGEGRLSHTMCGRPLGSDTTGEPLRKVLHLDANRPMTNLNVKVPKGAAALHVAMNAEDDGSGKNAFRFSVFNVEPAKGENACGDNHSGRFSFCRIEQPAAGLWTIVVNRDKGAGDVQVTAVVVR